MRLGVIAGAAALLAGAAGAETPRLEPGEWRTTQVMSNPFTGEQTRTETTCIRPEDATFDPARMVEDMDDCTVTTANESALTLDFTMACSMQGMEMNGDGSYRLAPSREAGEGLINMSAAADGVAFSMTIAFDAVRIGDC